MLVLYGSETGNAQDVAERVVRDSRVQGWEACAQPMDAVPMQSLAAEALVVFVCSTTGQGDTPTGMRQAWPALLRKSLAADTLSHLTYAVFGLGDSGYADYNVVAKKLDRRLEQLGARRLIEKGLGDDQHPVGYEAALDPWLEALVPAIASTGLTTPLATPASGGETDFSASCKYRVTVLEPAQQCNGANAASGTEAGKNSDISLQLFRDACAAAAAFAQLSAVASGTSLPSAEQPSTNGAAAGAAAPTASAAQPYWGTVTANERLTAQDHWQAVHHIEIDTAEAQGVRIKYEPGDIATLWPQVAPGKAWQVLQRLRIPEGAMVQISINDAAQPARLLQRRAAGATTLMRCSALAFAMGVLDAASASPRRRVLELMAHFATSELERDRLRHFGSAEGREDMATYCSRERRSLLEVLQDFPSCEMPLEVLLDAAPRLHPRQFSLASSPQAHGAKLQLCVAKVEYTTPYKRRVQGLCSPWLAALSPGDKVPVWIEKGVFALPPPQIPLMCVGPGTGIAPLRSFLSARAAQLRNGEAVAPSHLFFGCRSSAKDWLYQAEMEAWQKAGVLHQQHGLNTAFSRDQERKVYVQQRIREQSAQLWYALAEGGAYVFVSGSANKMPAAVAAAFEDVIAEGACCDEASAKRTLAQLVRARKYKVEAWS